MKRIFAEHRVEKLAEKSTRRARTHERGAKPFGSGLKADFEGVGDGLLEVCGVGLDAKVRDPRIREIFGGWAGSKAFDGVPKQAFSDRAAVVWRESLGERGHARNGTRRGGHVERVESGACFLGSERGWIVGHFQGEVEGFAMALCGRDHDACHVVLIAPKRIESTFEKASNAGDVVGEKRGKGMGVVGFS
jgi:hypothetical protein